MKVITTSHDIGDQQKYALRILKEDNFDAIHMHLKKGEHITTHHAKTHVIIIVRSGKVEFTIEGETVVLTNEDVLHMDPFEKHSLTAIEETDFMLIKVN